MSGTEIRAAQGLRSLGGNKVGGYAAVYNSESEDLGGFVEVIRPGAFKRSLNGNPDVVALVHHRPELVLGRTSAGTLRLLEDARGLQFEIDLPDTTAGRDIMVSVERGDVRGASFAFSVPDKGQVWNFGEDRTLRELLDVNVHDITLTANRPTKIRPSPGDPLKFYNLGSSCNWRLNIWRRSDGNFKTNIQTKRRASRGGQPARTHTYNTYSVSTRPRLASLSPWQGPRA